MPELPEVQTIIDHLIEQNILNVPITKFHTTMPKLFKNCTPKQFANHVVGEQIKTITRKGKFLIFLLTNEKSFVVHLRMEGKLFVEQNSAPFDPKHTLVFLTFQNQQLRYHDTRRFGTFEIYTNNAHTKAANLQKLALDPLEDGFSAAYLQKQIQHKTIAIKTALLDQTNVAGIGNIYADEILFASQIHPQTPANQLSLKQLEKLVQNAAAILKLAIANHGTTIHTYYYKKAFKGTFQNLLQVHTKKDLPCPTCRSTIVKIKVNNRGTYLCPNCQKKRKQKAS